MSDFEPKSVDVDVRTGSVDEASLDKGMFPTEAWEFSDSDTDTTPHLDLQSPWGVSHHGGEVIRKITISTSSPSGGSDGDIWLVREA